MPKKHRQSGANKKKSATLAVRSPQRKLKQRTYKSFKISKKIKHPSKISGALRLFIRTLATLKSKWKLFATITLIYAALNVLLVHGISGGLNLGDLKNTLQGSLNGRWGPLATGVSLFGYLLGSAGSSANPAGGVYQSLLSVLLSLVIIWALREVLAGHKIRARDAFYRGAYPLVPFILVLMVVGLQLLPLVVGSWLYSAVISNGLAVTIVEKTIWALLSFLLALLSLYMISSSLFALYIVTLPDMTPMKALRSARQLVLHRRWTILRKILFLPLALLVIGAVIVIPLILFVTAAAEWTFFLLGMLALLVVHAYMYTLYRELL